MESKSHIHAQLMYRIEKQKMKNLHNGGTHSTHTHTPHTALYDLRWFFFALFYYSSSIFDSFSYVPHTFTHTHTRTNRHIYDTRQVRILMPVTLYILLALRSIGSAIWFGGGSHRFVHCIYMCIIRIMFGTTVPRARPPKSQCAQCQIQLTFACGVVE